jgi:hypothetical protein
MLFDLERVRSNARQATTEDLMDRATVYRREMEPAALEVIDAELAARGVSSEALEAHARDRLGSLTDARGLPARCSFCPRPAVEKRRGWHRLWGLLPVFRREFYLCEEHRCAGEPAAGAVTSSPAGDPRPPG